jgi:hypothetical protein
VPAVVEYRRTYPPKIKTVSTPLYTTADVTPKFEMPAYFKDRAHDYFLISAKNYQLKDIAKYEPEFNKTYDSTKTFEQNVVLINTLLESIYQREKAATPAQKFKVGDRVLWKGKPYKIEMTEIFDGVFRYRFFTDEGYAMAREEDLQPTPPAAAEKITPEEAKEEAKLEKESEEEIKRTQAVEEEAEEEEGEIAQESSWKKGMPLTDEQIEWAKEEALMHIADYFIPNNALWTYDEKGKDAAVLFLKQQISNYGQGGPDEPDIIGTPKGIWITNEVMTPNEADSALPTAARLITYSDLLNWLLHNREAVEANIKKFKK